MCPTPSLEASRLHVLGVAFIVSSLWCAFVIFLLVLRKIRRARKREGGKLNVGGLPQESGIVQGLVSHSRGVDGMRALVEGKASCMYGCVVVSLIQIWVPEDILEWW